MQSAYGHAPLTGQPFDMNQLTSALPSAMDPAEHKMQPDFFRTYNMPASMPFAPPGMSHGQGRLGPQFDARLNAMSTMLNLQSGHHVSRVNPEAAVYNGGWDSASWKPAPWRSQKPAAPQKFGQGSLQANHPQLSHHELRHMPVPSNPRGPPRKPQRSGFALWIGNLPPFTKIGELKDHFSVGATDDIESVFLMEKSNCAFANYRTEAACVAAMNRFHNSRFRGRCLTCRLRRTTSNSSSNSSTSPLTGPEFPQSSQDALSPAVTPTKSPVIVGGLEDGVASSPTEDGRPKIPAKYFILKSLTLEDLKASVGTCTWATQPHNENILSNAYAEAEEVFLIFSANKSGEYFGYARMTSPIEPRTVTAEPITPVDSHQDLASNEPRVIPTPATASAPKGRIIDDSARGSIFWEADASDQILQTPSGGSSPGAGTGDGQFGIRWVSTTRIPFYQTRGMRNPWNENREIKIARDGQELDPRVGRRLLRLFDATAQGVPVDGALAGGYSWNTR